MSTYCIEICNAFTPGQRMEMGSSLEILSGRYRGNNMIELENGTWLRSYHDGRYITVNDEFERWAQVLIIELNDKGEYISSQLLGYTRV